MAAARVGCDRPIPKIVIANWAKAAKEANALPLPRQSRRSAKPSLRVRVGLQNMYGSFGVDLPRLINCAVTDLRANSNALVCIKSKPIRSFKYVAFEL